MSTTARSSIQAAFVLNGQKLAIQTPMEGASLKDFIAGAERFGKEGNAAITGVMDPQEARAAEKEEGDEDIGEEEEEEEEEEEDRKANARADCSDGKGERDGKAKAGGGKGETTQSCEFIPLLLFSFSSALDL